MKSVCVAGIVAGLVTGAIVADKSCRAFMTQQADGMIGGPINGPGDVLQPPFAGGTGSTTSVTYDPPAGGEGAVIGGCGGIVAGGVAIALASNPVGWVAGGLILLFSGGAGAAAGHLTDKGLAGPVGSCGTIDNFSLNPEKSEGCEKPCKFTISFDFSQDTTQGNQLGGGDAVFGGTNPPATCVPGHASRGTVHVSQVSEAPCQQEGDSQADKEITLNGQSFMKYRILCYGCDFN